jgi:hypothetical protein
MVPPSILEDGQQTTIGTPFDPLTRCVEMSGPVFHHDEEFLGAGLDLMLPPVERTTLEHGVPGVRIQDATLHSAHATEPPSLTVATAEICEAHNRVLVERSWHDRSD